MAGYNCEVKFLRAVASLSNGEPFIQIQSSTMVMACITKPGTIFSCIRLINLVLASFSADLVLDLVLDLDLELPMLGFA